MPYVGKKPADIIATAVDTTTGDFSGNVTAGGTLGVTGIGTFTDDIIIGDGKTIGSASKVDAITIAASGNTQLRSTGIAAGSQLFQIIDDGTTVLNVRSEDGNINFPVAGGGVYLGVTAAASSNLLNDYEEGDFTPTWNGYSPAGSTGRYTKIGRQVMVYTQLTTGGSTDTSEVQIDNLPFTVSGSLGGGTVYHNTTGLYPYTPLTLMTANSTVCKLKTVVGSGNEVGVKYNDGSSQPTLGGSATLRWSIFYETS